MLFATGVRRRLQLRFGLALAMLAASGVASAVSFRTVLTRPGLVAAQALARHPEGRWLAVGDADGLALHPLRPPGAPRRSWRGAVRALAFARGGTLWLGTERGLWRLPPDATAAEPVSLGPGATSQPVSRIAVGAGQIAVAADGVHWSRDGERFVALREGLPAGAPLALALREADEVEFAAAWARGLWRVAPETGATRELPLRASAEDPPRDLAFDDGGALWLLRGRSVERHGAGRVEERTLPLPPGARALRILAVGDRLVVSSDRGVLVGELPGPSWQPLALAGEAVEAIAAADAGFLVATRSGIHDAELRTKPGAIRDSASATRPPPAAAAPDAEVDHAALVTRLHRAALAAQGLGARDETALRQGVARRGWLPELELRGGFASGRRRFRDHDQIWSGGARRDLYDYGGDGDTEYDVSLHLAWDLGDLRFHPEAIDVSRETRARIELRDEVLDEVTRLYFDRQQRLAERAALPPDAHAERARLARDAAALAAGLDAWTGGAFTRLVRTATRLPRPEPEESR